MPCLCQILNNHIDSFKKDTASLKLPLERVFHFEELSTVPALTVGRIAAVFLSIREINACLIGISIVYQNMSKKKKKKTLQQILDYINDQSLRIKRVSRDYFMGTDIGTRRHKDKKKYNRRRKHKKDWRDE